MKLEYRAFATAAVAATLTATLLTPETAFSQSTPGTNAANAATRPAVNGPEEDPNLPDLPYPMPGAPIKWTANGAGTPIVTFLKPYFKATYLGFNERGSWLRNGDERKTYIWNLKDRTLILGADNDAAIPLDLRNPSLFMKDIIATNTGHASAGVTSASTQGRRTPYISPNVAGDGNAGHIGNEARAAISNPASSNPVGASRQIKGSGASIKAGVLTFVLDDPASPDNGKPVSFKVVRSAMNNPAQANGIAGMWIAEDPKNKDGVISLYVQGENGAVSGNAMSGFAAEAMKKMMIPNPQH